MIFSSAVKEPRPIRLSEWVREWAQKSLEGKYGDEAWEYFAIPLDDVPNAATMDELDLYDLSIRRIAGQAPLRHAPGEKLCGSATLGAATRHYVPVTLQGKYFLESVSHLTLNYEKTLHRGLNAYQAELNERIQDQSLNAGQSRFLSSLQNVLDAFRTWHKRYLSLTEKEAPELHILLQRVPFSPARTFHEALQSLWFTFAFVRLCGNWPGIGCMDRLLQPYLERDLQEGRITPEGARELIAHFFIKGCEWLRSTGAQASGDAQHYQNIVLAGRDEKGHEVANLVTQIILEVVEELPISDFPITVRLHKDSPRWLLTQMAKVIRQGGGVVAAYGEDTVYRALLQAGYPEQEIHRFANDGCWECQLPGETYFRYVTLDALQVLDEALGLHGGPLPHFDTMEEVYTAFHRELEKKVQALHREFVLDNYALRQDGYHIVHTTQKGSSVVSLFEEGCMEKARAYLDLGPRYTVLSPHMGGGPDACNSLYAIEQMVFTEHKCTMDELLQALRQNWEGHEPLRCYARSRYTYYGNDGPCDKWMQRIVRDFAHLVNNCKHDVPVKFLPGMSTFGRQVGWAPMRRATAFGARQGEILSGNTSPTPGTDGEGATAAIRSYCKLDLVGQTTGAALDIHLMPHTMEGENGLTALISLLKGFTQLWGYFMQLDVVDTQVLLEAQRHPENYRSLSVRVSGWNAHFVSLDENWQKMIVERTMGHV